MSKLLVCTVRIQTLYSVLSWSSFGSDYSLKSSWVWCDKLCTPGFWGFSAILLCRCSQALSGWMGTVGGQPFSCLSRDVKLSWSQGSGWATQGHSNSHSCAILAVCWGSLSYWKVNLQPSLRTRALWSRFLLRISLYFAPFSFPSTLTSPPDPAAKKRPHSITLQPPCFTIWDGIGQVMSGAWFPPDMTPKLKPNSWFNQNRESCFSQSGVLQVFFLQTISILSCVFHWGEASVWPVCYKALESVECVAMMGFLLEVSPIFILDLWISARVTMGFLFTSLTKALLPQTSSILELWRPLCSCEPSMQHNFL